MPWTESSTALSTNKLVAINAQDALHITGFEPFLTLNDANANNAQARLQNAGGNFVFYTRSGLSAGSPTVVFNTLDQPAGTPVPSAIEIHAQEGVQIVGFQPFLTLADANAGFAKASLQNAGGNFNFYTRSGLSAGSPTVVFNTLDQPAGTPVPSAIEIHAQDGVEVVGFEPFITLADANAGFAKARIQNANGDIVFYAQGGITTAIPAMIIESATGNVHVTGTITADKDIILAGADCAERFDVAGEDHLEAGTVVVIDREGTLRESSSAYDKRVAGVVAGAGDYRPAIVMGSRGVRSRRNARCTRRKDVLQGRRVVRLHRRRRSSYGLFDTRPCHEGERPESCFRRRDWEGASPAARRHGPHSDSRRLAVALYGPCVVVDALFDAKN